MHYYPFIGASFEDPAIFATIPSITVENVEDVVRDHSTSGIFYRSVSKISISLKAYVHPLFAEIAEESGFEVHRPETSTEIEEEEEEAPKARKGKKKVVEEEEEEEVSSASAYSNPNPYVIIPLASINVEDDDTDIREHQKFVKLYNKSERNANSLETLFEQYFQARNAISTNLVHSPELDVEEDDSGLTMPRLNSSLMEAQRYDHQKQNEEARQEIEEVYNFFETKILNGGTLEKVPFVDVPTYLPDGKVNGIEFTEWFRAETYKILGYVPSA